MRPDADPHPTADPAVGVGADGDPTARVGGDPTADADPYAAVGVGADGGAPGGPWRWRSAYRGPPEGGQHPPRDERGSASILMLGLVAVAVVLFIAGAVTVRTAQARAESAGVADLAAIAGAQAANDPAGTSGQGCARAAAVVAAAPPTLLLECAETSGLAGTDVTVLVSREVAPVRGWSIGSVTAAARAGPVTGP